MLFGLSFLLAFAYNDYRKKRPLTRYPFVTFMVPTWNDGPMLKDTIESIFDSYPKNKLELIVINDNSPDNTSQILKQLQKKYKFIVITNKTNIGKVKAMNKAARKAKGEIIFNVDSDLIVNKKAVEDMMARLLNPKVGGVSARYRPRNKGFLAFMQSIEYGLSGIIAIAHNPYSSFFMWGGCMAIKKTALKQIGYFTEEAWIEDIDAALKLNGKGWKVQQTPYLVKTYVPGTVFSWWKQKVRWGGGAFQAILRHNPSFLTNPVTMFITFVLLLFWIAFGFAVSSIMNGGLVVDLVLVIWISIVYPLFWTPFIIANCGRELRRKPYYILNIFPFAFIYMPAIIVAGTYGTLKATYKLLAYGDKERVWFNEED